MKDFTIVVAHDSELGIGKTGALPWRLKEDMKHFRELTTGDGTNLVVMGRKTWESIPEKFRPLPNRKNVVISRNKNATTPGPWFTMTKIDDALKYEDGHVFVIGGGEIYRETIGHPSCGELIITRVDKSFDCDIVFPRYDDRFKLDSVIGGFVESGINCSIERWLRR